MIRASAQVFFTYLSSRTLYWHTWDPFSFKEMSVLPGTNQYKGRVESNEWQSYSKLWTWYMPHSYSGQIKLTHYKLLKFNNNMHKIRRSNNCVLRFPLEAFSCDEVQHKAKERLPTGQYVLTNGSVSSEVSKSRWRRLLRLSRRKLKLISSEPVINGILLTNIASVILDNTCSWQTDILNQRLFIKLWSYT